MTAIRSRATVPNPPRARKRTPTTLATLLTTLERGATRTAACASAGISLDTLARWRDADPEIEEKLVRAEGKAHVSMSNVLFEAAMGGDWRAAESWLKRRRPEEWGDKQTAEINGTIDSPMSAFFAESIARIYGADGDEVTEAD